ncbi:Uma2 family endonuclease [Nocardia coubleae]|uniref:Uma2 family endonuclease n=1 Tax=Nocardia coubleae TaxID=356147 RepID=A0A846W800_9NOCA|nr:Uma2 family endonuclease [Nocardia coubleae]NKX89361.1 Uma2 family endonuclease [Nocardia coubleae]
MTKSAEVSLTHPLGPIAVDDWLVGGQPTDGTRLELIWGYPVVSPPPGGAHRCVADKLLVAMRSALRAADRDDLTVLRAVPTRISAPLRIAVIPDVIVTSGSPRHVSCGAEDVLLAVDVWSRDNPRAERDTRMAAFAAARVPHLWIIDLTVGERVGFEALGLGESGYRRKVYAADGETVTAPGPVPVPIDTGQLAPR